MSATAINAPNRLTDQLRSVLGPENVIEDPKTICLFSQDIYSRAPHTASLIIRPQTTDELARSVQEVTTSGRSLVTRGAGMSYTGAYLPSEPDCVILDTLKMASIKEINADDMYVTVEVGCNWNDLYIALKAQGLRTPFYGPLSGLTSTIGGGLSQNNALLGAGTYGPTSESVISLKVVLADGTIIDTATAGTLEGTPFFRHYGPDLTGLFLADAGTLGVKAEATFRLIQIPAHEGYASFSFARRDDAIAATSALSRAGLGTELFGFDPNLQNIRMKRARLTDDLKSLGSVVKKQTNVISGIKEVAKIAVAGRNFTSDDEYSVHIAVEGRTQATIEGDLEAIRKITSDFQGREIENTIPKVIRAAPFTPLNNIVGADGERWAPIHGIVPHSKAQKVWAKLDDYFSINAARFDELGCSHGFLMTTLSTNAFLIEPVFFWPSQLDEIHRATVDSDLLSKMTIHDVNEDASALIDEARHFVIKTFKQAGAAHFQIGKTYPFYESRKPETWALIDSLKSLLDPNRRLNPGGLGFS